MANFLKNIKSRFIGVVREQLRRGITPHKLALTLTLGTTIATFPVLGSTTLLCLLAGAALGLNQPLLQFVNYLAYPLQIPLIPVFIRIGEHVTGAAPVPFDFIAWKNAFVASPLHFAGEFGLVAARAALAWAIVMPLPAWLLYRAARPAFARYAARRNPAGNSP